MTGIDHLLQIKWPRSMLDCYSRPMKRLLWVKLLIHHALKIKGEIIEHGFNVIKDVFRFSWLLRNCRTVNTRSKQKRITGNMNMVRKLHEEICFVGGGWTVSQATSKLSPTNILLCTHLLCCMKAFVSLYEKLQS